eukprot:562139-Pyramimonas_sp.AAC.1
MIALVTSATALSPPRDVVARKRGEVGEGKGIMRTNQMRVIRRGREGGDEGATRATRVAKNTRLRRSGGSAE